MARNLRFLGDSNSGVTGGDSNSGVTGGDSNSGVKKVNLGGLLDRAKPMWIEIAQSASASAEAEWECAHHLKVRQGTEWLLTNHNGTDKHIGNARQQRRSHNP